MSTSKTYTFIWHRDGQSPERIEKEEHELTQQEKDYLMGTLIKAWNDNTPENQRKFIDSMFKQPTNQEILDFWDGLDKDNVISKSRRRGFSAVPPSQDEEE